MWDRDLASPEPPLIFNTSDVLIVAITHIADGLALGGYIADKIMMTGPKSFLMLSNA